MYKPGKTSNRSRTHSQVLRDRTGEPKRLICCCDGTWMDSLGEHGGAPQSNVTRISRVLRRTCNRGMHQVISYNPGVGSGNAIDRITGGMFGAGLEQIIREVYNFICINYVDGDDIILIGFSRGAFTARSVADVIASIGLLTPAGLEHFYAIFEDYEYLGQAKRPLDEFLCRHLPPYNGEEGEDKLEWERKRKKIYRKWLKSLGYTRDKRRDGKTPITIKAVAVWDTVGTLGVPPAPVALALDEPRYAFRPALWERINGNQTNLKQVWFPGNHGAPGGGWHDQQIANIALAWMCDQLSTLGVEFNLERMTEVFMDGLSYSAKHPFPFAGSSSPLPSWASFLWNSEHPAIPWGSRSICNARDPLERDVADHNDECVHTKASTEEFWRTARPWALGQIRAPTNRVMNLAGSTIRHPGLFMRMDCDTNTETDQPLLNTSERIHSSVRVRLACGGLDLDDSEPYRCKALYGKRKRGNKVWRLQRGNGFECSASEKFGRSSRSTLPRELELGYPEENMYPIENRDGDWQWVFGQDIHGSGRMRTPQALVLPEEPLTGYWERYLLKLTAGAPDVWQYALRHPPSGG